MTMAAKYCFGKVIEPAGQKKQNEDDRRRGSDRGELRLGAVAIVGRGTGSASTDLHAAKDAGGDIGHAKRTQLLVGSTS